MKPPDSHRGRSGQCHSTECKSCSVGYALAAIVVDECQVKKQGNTDVY